MERAREEKERQWMHLLGRYFYCSPGLWFYLRTDTLAGFQQLRGTFSSSERGFRVFLLAHGAEQCLQRHEYHSCPIGLGTSSPQLPPPRRAGLRRGVCKTDFTFLETSLNVAA